MVIYSGFGHLSGGPMMLFLLTAFFSIVIHAFFFFGLRIPSTGLLFWILAGFIVLLTGPASQPIAMPLVLAPLLAVFFALYLWQTVFKEVMASYYFMLFQKTKKAEEKETFCKKATKWCPKDTMLNTHMLIGHMHSRPEVAYKYAEEMWTNHDGMTPGWIVYFNMGTAAEMIGNKVQAFRHYMTSHRLLPSFQPTVERLTFLEPFISFPREGEIMKQAKEEVKLGILLNREKMQNMELQRQNLQLAIQNMVTQEAARLNIPEGWHYDFDSGQFLSPEELAQKQQAATTKPEEEKKGEEGK